MMFDIQEEVVSYAALVQVCTLIFLFLQFLLNKYCCNLHLEILMLLLSLYFLWFSSDDYIQPNVKLTVCGLRFFRYIFIFKLEKQWKHQIFFYITSGSILLGNFSIMIIPVFMPISLQLALISILIKLILETLFVIIKTTCILPAEAKRDDKRMSFIIFATISCICFGDGRLPWTIYSFGCIMTSYFPKWMFNFSDIKNSIPYFKNLHLDVYSNVSKTSPINVLQSSFVMALAIILPYYMIGYSITILTPDTPTVFDEFKSERSRNEENDLNYYQYFCIYLANFIQSLYPSGKRQQIDVNSLSSEAKNTNKININEHLSQLQNNTRGENLFLVNDDTGLFNIPVFYVYISASCFIFIMVSAICYEVCFAEDVDSIQPTIPNELSDLADIALLSTDEAMLMALDEEFIINDFDLDNIDFTPHEAILYALGADEEYVRNDCMNNNQELYDQNKQHDDQIEIDQDYPYHNQGTPDIRSNSQLKKVVNFLSTLVLGGGNSTRPIIEQPAGGGESRI